MNMLELIKSRRTIRKYQQQKIDQSILTELVECARMAPSAANRQPDSVVALGYPAEKSVTEEAGDSIKYYKDADQVLHVPKRPLNSILHIDKW